MSQMSPMSTGLGCLGCGPGSRYSDHRGHRRAVLRNRKVEIVLWVFIIFLLIVIGLLTYSHLQLLTTLNDEGMDPFSETFSRWVYRNPLVRNVLYTSNTVSCFSAQTRVARFGHYGSDSNQGRDSSSRRALNGFVILHWPKYLLYAIKTIQVNNILFIDFNSILTDTRNDSFKAVT